MKLFSTVCTMMLIAEMFAACNGQETQAQAYGATCPDTGRIVVDRSPLFPDSLMARDLQLTGLEDLRHGFRDLQIRIWRQPAHTDTFQVFVLKQVGNTYQAWMNEYRYQLKDSGYIPTGASKLVRALKGTSSWAELRERMAISELFAQSDIDDQSSDQSGASIELSTCARYKIFFQLVYGIDRPQKNAVERLLPIIEKEFGVVWVKGQP